MQTRTLGRTGAELSIVGFGGIVVMNESAEDAARIVKTAIDRGVTYFDVAPSYGNAEQMLGPALEPYRDGVFLACKTGKRTADEARAELEGSLERLRTDHFDLYQFHGVTKMEDAETILAPGGALETAVAAREAGTVKHLGFSAHSEDAALALMAGFEFDSVLFPVNIFCWHHGNFGRRILEDAKRRGMGALALKSLAHKPWAEGEKRTWKKCWYRPLDEARAVSMALRFTLSKGVTAAVCPSHEELLWLACDAADAYEPLTDEEERAALADLDGAPIFKSE